MADLKNAEKRKLERLLVMGGGYVADFTDRRFAEFVADSVNRNIYDDKYSERGNSKANRLRAFWSIEPEPLVGKLLGDILDYLVSESWLKADADLLPDCRATVERLLAGSTVPDVGELAKIVDERDLEVVARAVREAIDKNEPVLGLDRLHTFATKFLRALCERHGLATGRDEPLNSIFGKYVKKLRDEGQLQSKMTASLLKSMFVPFEDFNKVRNDHSLAHDNQLLNHDEAVLIFHHVTSSLRFIKHLEDKLQKQIAVQALANAKDAPPFDDDIPF